MRSRAAAVLHLASSGGTVLARRVVARYQIVIVNEVHPFAPAPAFNPSFPVASTIGQVDWSQEDLGKLFDHQMARITRKAKRSSSEVFLRIHSHSDYFDDGVKTHSSTGLDKWIAKAVVTVRNPLTNFVSARERGFFSGGLSEWIARASAFIEDYAHLPRFRFESIMVNPEEGIDEIGSTLELSKRLKVLEEKEIPFLSGDNRIRGPIVGEAFRARDLANHKRIINDPTYREEVIRSLPALQSFQRLLGYEETEV